MCFVVMTQVLAVAYTYYKNRAKLCIMKKKILKIF